MRYRGWMVSVALGLVIASACGPAPVRSMDPQGGASAERAPSRALTIIMRVEPPQIYDSAVDRSAIQRPLFTASLGIWSLQETPEPVLAQLVPQLNTDSWRVLPDGRMETEYRLRPALAWHDGTPLTAADFVFTRRADLARVEWGLQQTSAELRAMEDILAADSQTVVIRWREPFTEAAAPGILVHPRHVLEGPLAAGDGDSFGNHPFWTTEYVGLGPYRLERWERGAFVEAVAFDGYALGRPKIDRVRLTWNNDPNVSLTRLLAGDADIALDGAIRYEQAAILKTRWNAQQGDTILLNPTSLRYIQVQARQAYVTPQALLDPRTRKALIHAIDRGTLAETMLEDRNMVADTVPPPTAASYAAVERVLTKYPFDLRRTEQLMAEVGYTKGPDGVYTSPSQGRFQMEVRGVSGGQEEQDTTLVANYFREAGFDPTILLLPSSARAVDDRMKGTFPGLTLNNNTLQRGLGLNKWLTSNIGGPHDNWVGGNRMGWSNLEFDRLYAQWTTSLDRTVATQHLAQMMKILNEELPSPSLYYNFQVVAHISALRGPLPITPDSTRYYNVHQWEWRAL